MLRKISFFRVRSFRFRKVNFPFSDGPFFWQQNLYYFHFFLIEILQDNKFDTSTSLSLTSLCTNSTNMTNQSKLSSFSPDSQKSPKIYRDLIDENNNQWSLNSSPTTSFGNQIVAKKIRLVKRLKNRIETKSGQKLQFSVPKLINSTSALNFKIKNTLVNTNNTNNNGSSPYSIRKMCINKRNIVVATRPEATEKSIEPMNTDLPKIQLPATRDTTYENNSQQYLSDNMVQSRNRSFIIDTSIEPVYF